MIVSSIFIRYYYISESVYNGCVLVSTVQNTLSYDVFGANYRFYNLNMTIAKEQAQADVMVIIPEVKNSYKITESLAKVNAIRAYKGSSKANFVKKVPKAIVDLWN